MSTSAAHVQLVTITMKMTSLFYCLASELQERVQVFMCSTQLLTVFVVSNFGISVFLSDSYRVCVCVWINVLGLNAR